MPPKLLCLWTEEELGALVEAVIEYPETGKGKKYVYENKIALGRYFCIQKFIEKRTGLKKDVKSIASRIQVFSSILKI